MQAVILAGGLATRLYPITENMPKSMMIINGRPFLEYQLDLLRKNDIDDIVLCVGHLSGQIKNFFKNGEDFGVRIRYSEESDRLLGTAGALKNAEKLFDDEFFVMYGDSYLPIDFMSIMNFFKDNNKLAVMTVYKNFDKYDKSNIVIERGLIKEYDKNIKTKDMIYIDYGLSILKKSVLQFIPIGESYSLEDMFRKLIIDKKLFAFEVDQRFYEIGSFNGIKEFKQYISSSRGDAITISKKS